jgi:DNA-binding transcriptional LysR family regulator
VRGADGLSEVRVGDLVTFLAVQRSGSITSAARELRVTPSQVSKAIARLEEHLHLRLLSRSSRGVALSETGQRILPHVEGALTRLRMVRRIDGEGEIELSVAAPSYLIGVFLPRLATSLARAQHGGDAAASQMRVRGIELPPALIRALAAQNVFDVALLPSSAERLPASWTSEQAGELKKSLFGTPAMQKRLGPGPVAADRLRDIPFVCPIYNAEGAFVAVDDDCPLSHSERRLGHEAQTIGLALELAARTDQLVFGPVVAARRHLGEGSLVEIRVRGWNVTEPLHIACNGDRVLSRVRAAALKAVHEELTGIEN